MHFDRGDHYYSFVAKALDAWWMALACDLQATTYSKVWSPNRICCRERLTMTDQIIERATGELVNGIHSITL